MAADSEADIFARHAAAVVGYANERLAAVQNFNFDVLGAGVEGIFNEFLDAGRRTFDDLTGGDFVNCIGIEQADFAQIAILLSGDNFVKYNPKLIQCLSLTVFGQIAIITVGKNF